MKTKEKEVINWAIMDMNKILKNKYGEFIETDVKCWVDKEHLTSEYNWLVKYSSKVIKGKILLFVNEELPYYTMKERMLKERLV